MRAAKTPKGTIGWLTKRADYLALQTGTRWATPFFVMQVRPLKDDVFAWRVGFTTSRKVGNAVTRNRARRRLRELVRNHLPEIMRPGFDVVLIGRTSAASVPFDKLMAALTDAVQKLKVAV